MLRSEPPVETKAENKFRLWVEKERKELCFKINPLGRAGLPDRIIVGKDRLIFFIEFKRAGKTPRKLQTYIHKLLREFGFNVYVCYSLEEAQEAYWKERAALW